MLQASIRRQVEKPAGIPGFYGALRDQPFGDGDIELLYEHDLRYLSHSDTRHPQYF